MSPRGMLLIRNEQFVALTGGAEQRYEARVLDYVRRDFPERFAAGGEEGVRDLLARATAAAAGYGLVRQVDITGFLSLMIVLGEDFRDQERHAWIREILESTMVDPREKIRTIVDSLG